MTTDITARITRSLVGFERMEGCGGSSYREAPARAWLHTVRAHLEAAGLMPDVHVSWGGSCHRSAYLTVGEGHDGATCWTTTTRGPRRGTRGPGLGDVYCTTEGHYRERPNASVLAAWAVLDAADEAGLQAALKAYHEGCRVRDSVAN